MVEIHNNIDGEYFANIYYKDKYVGRCDNELAFLDVRLQIREEKDDNYSFELIKTNIETGEQEISDRYKFDEYGSICHPMSFKLYWPSYDRLIKEIVGI